MSGSAPISPVMESVFPIALSESVALTVTLYVVCPHGRLSGSVSKSTLLIVGVNGATKSIALLSSMTRRHPLVPSNSILSLWC